LFPLYDTIPSRRKPYVLYAIIVANFIVFFYELSLSNRELLDFFYHFGLVPARFTVPKVRNKLGFSILPWLSHMFVHGGWAHIIGNMWFLWIFGDNVEDAMGHGKFLGFYFLGGIFAALVNFIFAPFSTTPMVGASGAISAIMGAYFVLFPHSRIVSLVFFFVFFTFVEIPAFVYLLFWFVMQVFNGLISVAMPISNVAWWAHAGGFVFGVLAGLRLRKRYYTYWTGKNYYYWW